ncbi:MAG: hypothetical protein RMK29_18795 [Myxococcales bacterium]|nr:hypothetical protein [Myxococcota bacterium]MDW8283756.1 hypothetical protein [Myxococcales bacterium]
MRGMHSAWKWKLAVGWMVLFCLAPGRASADLHLAFGTRWQPLRYTTAAYPMGNPGGFGGLRPPLGLSGFQTTSLDPYLALFFAQKYGLLLSLDIGYGRLGGETQVGMAAPEPNNTSFFQFGLALGFKFYITQPRRERVAPYLYADFYKYFASINADKASTDQVSFAAGLLSPIGATFAFGAEYFVTPNFSVGSEVLGLKVANAASDLTVGMAPNTSRTSMSYTYVTFYTAISLNFRFQVQASVQAEEEERSEEEAQPARKKKRPRQQASEGEEAPPTPPPPTPEAID